LREKESGLASWVFLLVSSSSGSRYLKQRLKKNIGYNCIEIEKEVWFCSG